MADILDEASSLIECKECPWYKSCVRPTQLSREELTKQLEQVIPSGVDSTKEYEFRSMMLSMAAMIEETVLEACPIFMRRLKSSPGLAEQLKKLMQSWNKETETSE
jgi:hypothetical protein